MPEFLTTEQLAEVVTDEIQLYWRREGRAPDLAEAEQLTTEFIDYVRAASDIAQSIGLSLGEAVDLVRVIRQRHGDGLARAFERLRQMPKISGRH